MSRKMEPGESPQLAFPLDQTRKCLACIGKVGLVVPNTRLARVSDGSNGLPRLD